MNSESPLLVRFLGQIDSATLQQCIAAANAAANGAFHRVEANVAVDGSRTYVYFWTHEPGIPDALVHAVTHAWLAVKADLEDFEAVRLDPVLQIPSASAGAKVNFHYAVEADVDDVHEDEMAAWYALEHMPGLASVTGNIRSLRMNNLDGGPRSFACYDFITLDILKSAPWQAVRATAWSGRVRPMFKNTRRTVFERIVTQNLA
jgi:hypothetical protein